MKDMNLTKDAKELVLINQGWVKTIGYAMDYEAPEMDNIVITIEEFKSKIGKQAEEYWSFKDDFDYLRNLDDAWECMEDNLYQILDTNDDVKIRNHIIDILIKDIPDYLQKSAPCLEKGEKN